MRKMLSAALLICMVALLSTLSMPAVSAKPEGALKCEFYIKLNWDWVGFGGMTPYTWIGAVSGDINGEFYITLQGASYPGGPHAQTEHFSEKWIIVTTDGSVLEGVDEGVWSFKNFNWVANGGVTKVTPPTGTWAYLVGSNMQYSGTTNGSPDFVNKLPLYGTGIMKIMPGK